MINNTKSYFRKDTSTLFISSAAIALLLSSTLLLSNALLLLLQPAQATTISYTSIQTKNPVKLGRACSAANATLTFEAKGNGETLTNGTFQITNGSSSSGQTLWSGHLYNAESLEEGILLVYGVVGNVPVCGIGSGDELQIRTDCGAFTELSTDGGDFIEVPAEVDCEFPHHTTTTTTTTTAQQPSSSTPMTAGTTTTQQDSDSDGIPDSSDRCTHNSNPKCFKDEGDTSNSTTQQPSSTTRTGNQTR